jgi:hypothetical protein
MVIGRAHRASSGRGILSAQRLISLTRFAPVIVETSVTARRYGRL